MKKYHIEYVDNKETCEEIEIIKEIGNCILCKNNNGIFRLLFEEDIKDESIIFEEIDMKIIYTKRIENLNRRITDTKTKINSLKEENQKCDNFLNDFIKELDKYKSKKLFVLVKKSDIFSYKLNVYNQYTVYEIDEDKEKVYTRIIDGKEDFINGNVFEVYSEAVEFIKEKVKDIKIFNDRQIFAKEKTIERDKKDNQETSFKLNKLYPRFKPVFNEISKKYEIHQLDSYFGENNELEVTYKLPNSLFPTLWEFTHIEDAEKAIENLIREDYLKEREIEILKNLNYE